MSNTFEDWSPIEESGGFPLLRAKYPKNQHFRKEPEYIAKVHGEFLLLMIRIVNSRWVGMCEMSPESQLRRTLLHMLAIDFQPWSTIQKQFRARNYDSLNLSRIESLLKDRVGHRSPLFRFNPAIRFMPKMASNP